MGTVAAVQWKGDLAEPKRTVALVKQTFAEVEFLLNAHVPSSELSQLAALPDVEVLRRCNPLVRPCYAAAFALRDETDRLFNPRFRGPGTLDLGAIAKGFAVDLAVERLSAAGIGGECLLDLGGNLRAVGGRWSVGIADADADRGAPVLTLQAGEACATSGEYFRGQHIRNGRDGSAPTNAVYSVTVVHPSSALQADGLSTVLFLLGPEQGQTYLRRSHPEARSHWIR